MAPSTTQTEALTQTPRLLQLPNKIDAFPASINHYIPLQLSGALDQLELHELTPLMGTQFENINLTEILHSPVCDQIIRDIAITSKYYQCNAVQDISSSIRRTITRLHDRLSICMRLHVYLCCSSK